MTRFARPLPAAGSPVEERALAYAERMGHLHGTLRAAITTIEIFGLDGLDKFARERMDVMLRDLKALNADLDAEHEESMRRNFASPMRLSDEALATPLARRILKEH
jgi:hypothetical protein